MKKVLIVTIQENKNYGNRLQNYALQFILEQMGYQVENLMPKKENMPSLFQRLKHFLRRVLFLFGLKKYGASISHYHRRTRLIAFTNEHIHGKRYIDRGRLSETDWSDLAWAVAGSDQIWHNWNWKEIPNELLFYYLDFIEETKRISYAPSFGFSAFPEEDIEEHRRGLMGMRALSCREQEGCDLIYELTGRTAQKVLDPTLLLSAEKWAAIEKKPRFRTPENYLLLFFLGEKTDEYRMEIKRIADLRGLTVLDVTDANDPKHFGISPNEFIWLIHHADTVCTDSFHASVFSITFERNLRVFKRKQAMFEDMFGRLRDLLEPLGLLSLVYGVGDRIDTALSSEANAFLSEERKRSIRYLEESLNS